MDATAIAIVAIVVVAVVALVVMAGHRRWNADGSDDARRDKASHGDAEDPPERP